MLDLFTALLMVTGAGFMLLAAVGVMRMPDVWMRMHASTKSATFGIGCMALALAVYSAHELSVVMRSVIVIGFVFQTAPVAGHMIGRAAYLMGVRPWRGTLVDELEGRYDSAGKQLAGLGEEPAPGAGPAG